MTRHPGGEEQTLRLLELAGLGLCGILDMGAGDGDTVRLLRGMGFDARGIDLTPGVGVERGDFLHSAFRGGEFDAAISQCAFFVSGDVPGAFREAARLIRQGGRLLLSDVCFSGEGELREAAEAAGFRALASEDRTEDWKKYYIECIWNGTAENLCAEKPAGKCAYYLMTFERT